MNKGIFNTKDISDWIDDPKVPKGCTKANATYLYKIRELIEVYSQYGALLFFLAVNLKMYPCRTMMYSVKKQKKFLQTIDITLKEKAVTKEYIPIFERNIKAFENRCEHIFRMIRENIRLTEYYPYFESVNYEVLVDFDKDFGEVELMYILDEYEKFKNDNPEIIARHIESIAEEKRIREEHFRKIKEQEAAEKEFLKEKKRIERVRERQIAEEIRKRKLKEKWLEKTFETHYS